MLSLFSALLNHLSWNIPKILRLRETQLPWKISPETLEVSQIPWKPGCYNGNCWAIFLIGGATNLLHSQDFTCVVYRWLYYQLLSSELKISRKTKREGKQKGGRATSWTRVSPENLSCGQSGQWETPKDSFLSATALQSCTTHMPITDTEGFPNMNSLYLSKVMCPNTTASQTDA